MWIACLHCLRVCKSSYNCSRPLTSRNRFRRRPTFALLRNTDAWTFATTKRVSEQGYPWRGRQRESHTDGDPYRSADGFALSISTQARSDTSPPALAPANIRARRAQRARVNAMLVLLEAEMRRYGRERRGREREGRDVCVVMRLWGYITR